VCVFPIKYASLSVIFLVYSQVLNDLVSGSYISTTTLLSVAEYLNSFLLNNNRKLLRNKLVELKHEHHHHRCSSLSTCSTCKRKDLDIVVEVDEHLFNIAAQSAINYALPHANTVVSIDVNYNEGKSSFFFF
jgi:hypothetical protein